MRLDDIQQGRLYAGRSGTEFRFIVPYEYHRYGEGYHAADLWYLCCYPTSGVSDTLFSNRYRTFQTWAERVATPAEFEAIKAQIEVALKTIERKGKRRLAAEKRGWAKISRDNRERVIASLTKEELEAELAKRTPS